MSESTNELTPVFDALMTIDSETVASMNRIELLFKDFIKEQKKNKKRRKQPEVSLEASTMCVVEESTTRRSKRAAAKAAVQRTRVVINKALNNKTKLRRPDNEVEKKDSNLPPMSELPSTSSDNNVLPAEQETTKDKSRKKTVKPTLPVIEETTAELNLKKCEVSLQKLSSEIIDSYTKRSSAEAPRISTPSPIHSSPKSREGAARISSPSLNQSRPKSCEAVASTSTPLLIHSSPKSSEKAARISAPSPVQSSPKSREKAATISTPSPIHSSLKSREAAATISTPSPIHSSPKSHEAAATISTPSPIHSSTKSRESASRTHPRSPDKSRSIFSSPQVKVRKLNPVTPECQMKIILTKCSEADDLLEDEPCQMVVDGSVQDARQDGNGDSNPKEENNLEQNVSNHPVKVYSKKREGRRGTCSATSESSSRSNLSARAQASNLTRLNQDSSKHVDLASPPDVMREHKTVSIRLKSISCKDESSKKSSIAASVQSGKKRSSSEMEDEEVQEVNCLKNDQPKPTSPKAAIPVPQTPVDEPQKSAQPPPVVTDPAPVGRMTRTKTREMREKCNKDENQEQSCSSRTKKLKTENSGKENKKVPAKKFPPLASFSATPLSNLNSIYSSSSKKVLSEKPKTFIFQASNSTASNTNDIYLKKQIKKLEKEEIVFRKKEEHINQVRENVRRNREQRIEKVTAHKLATEREKQEQLAKLERERIEKEKQILAEKEKQREEMLLKKKLKQQKFQEAEERRIKEEQARLARLKEIEEEQRKLAELRLKQEEEAEKLRQKRLAEERLQEAQKKAKKLKDNSKKVVVDEYNMTPLRHERIPLAPKYSDDYGISDAEASDSSDCESQPKKAIPNWAKKGVRDQAVFNQSLLNPELISHLFPMASTTPSIQSLFPELNEKLPRSSSAHWPTP